MVMRGALTGSCCCCCVCACVQARYHPDKVPPSADLSERVYAEEVSKILNAHNWGC